MQFGKLKRPWRQARPLGQVALAMKQLKVPLFIWTASRDRDDVVDMDARQVIGKTFCAPRAYPVLDFRERLLAHPSDRLGMFPYMLPTIGAFAMRILGATARGFPARTVGTLPVFAVPLGKGLLVCLPPAALPVSETFWVRRPRLPGTSQFGRPILCVVPACAGALLLKALLPPTPPAFPKLLGMTVLPPALIFGGACCGSCADPEFRPGGTTA